MSRLLCVGDLHLGAGADYGREPGDRLADQEQVWTAILEIAAERQIDAVLFAGDAFHRRRPTPAELRAFQGPLQAFTAETGIPVLAINGNHDVESGHLPSALDLFGRELDLHARPGLWHTFGGADVSVPGGMTVATLPWAPTGKLVATLGGGDRDELNATAAEMLVRAARDLRNQVDGPCVLMLHWSVSGASTPTGVLTDEFHEVVLDADALAGLGFDAIVCGHIHKAQYFDAVNGWVEPVRGCSDGTLVVPAAPFFYTGSPMPVDFGEASTPHGIWLLDIDEKIRPHHVHADFLPIESRPFVTIDVDCTTVTDQHPNAGHNLIVDELEAHDLSQAVVRIRYRATEAQAAQIDQRVLRDIAVEEGAHKVYNVTPEIVRENRARVEHVDDDLTPAAALAMYADANQLGDDDRPALIEDTLHYLNEVGA